MANKDPWQTISLALPGILDTRSRPANLPPGAFRWKLNWAITEEGNLYRRPGFERHRVDMLYDNSGVPLTDPAHGDGIVYHNHDHHHQGTTREPISMLFESTASTGTRRLFDGTQSRVSLLNDSTGYWTDIITGKGSFGSRWKSAELADKVLFTNNVDNIHYYDLNSAAVGEIPQLKNTMQTTAARVIVQYQGFILVMNVVQAGVRKNTRIRWSDLNLPFAWDVGTADTLAGFQDLDYGDEILAAAPLLGALYIYTRRSIWKCVVSGAEDKTFDFVRVYNEPKNQKGCLVYENTLVSTGKEHFYMSREAIYRFSPYTPQPEKRDSLEWLHRGSGVIFTQEDTKLLGVTCASPVAEYIPLTNELWFSWPSGTNVQNNWTLVAQLDQKTCDVVDHGFITFVNNRTNADGVFLCNEDQDFLATSSRDYAIKKIGGVYYREFATLVDSDPVNDLELDQPPQPYTHGGYFSILRGQIPTGFYDRVKELNKVYVGDDTTEFSGEVIMRLRIGNEYNLVDPNNEGDRGAPVWRQLEDKILDKPNSMTRASMVAQNLRPDEGHDWPAFEEGRFLYFEFKIANADKSPAIGGETYWYKIDFNVRAKPKDTG